MRTRGLVTLVVLLDGYPPAAARLATEERGELDPTLDSDVRDACFEMSLARDPGRALLPADVMLFDISRAAY